MANDTSWVNEVKRWYLASVQQNAPAASPIEADIDELGYEAAQPSLESRLWDIDSTYEDV
jgi:hypothetical protein